MLGVDVVPHVVDTVSRGDVHIVEPELDAIVKAAVTSGRLKAVLKPQPADVFIITVPTPFFADRSPDLSYVEAAALSIAPVLKKGNLVILESTCPVGSTEQIAELIAKARPDLKIPKRAQEIPSDIFMAYCPERVLPGKIIRELVENDRVIGGLTRACAERAKKLYQVFVNGECVLTDCRTAELCKLSENSFRDVNIAFANELSLICDRLGVDAWELISLANRHPRVKILNPGPGVGGHCIAVDPWFIVSSAPQEAKLIRTAREVNDYKPHHVVGKVLEQLNQLAVGSKVACLGLSFKADIDDLRESPSVEIVHELAQRIEGRSLLVVEPHITALPPALEKDCPNVKLVSLEDAFLDAELLVLLVDHKVFRLVSKETLEGKRIIDTRGIWSATSRSKQV